MDEFCDKENIILPSKFGNPCAMSNSKFADILNYLEEVERDDDAKSISVTSCVAQSQSGSVLAEAMVGSMNSKINMLKTRLVEKQQVISVLKRKIADYKSKEANVSSELQLRLQKQKQEFEGTASRNMDFIKTLLADKEQLNRRIESLCVELKQLEAKHQRKIEEVEERHASILASQKVQWEKLEKRRRTVWVEEQTKKIKENALKALEPEIAQLLCKHRQEKQRLEDEKAEELRRKDALVAQKEREMVEGKRWVCMEKDEELRRKDLLLASKDKEILELRTRLTHDFDQTLVQERERFLQQNKELCERYERQLEEARQHLRTARTQEEDARLHLEQLNLKDKSKSNLELTSKLSAAEKDLRNALEEEFQAKERRYRESVDRTLAETKEKLKAERDAEIALVIEKVEDSVLQLRKEKQLVDTTWQEKYTSLQRERDELSLKVQDYKAELTTLTAKHHETLKLLKATEEQLADALQQQSASTQASQTTLARQLQQCEEACKAKLTTQLQEQQSTIQSLGKQRGELQSQLQSQLAAHEQLVTNLTTQHASEFTQLQVRFQQTLAKKDRALAELQAALQSSQERVRQIERLLRKQGLLQDDLASAEVDLEDL